jgi:amidase
MTSLADDTRWLDATDQAALVRNGSVSAGELLEAAIERIEAIDPALNAVNLRWFDHARDVAAGALPEGPFRGVPFLLKDLWAAFDGQPLSNGNKALRAAGYRADFDTTLVARFKAAGLVIAGRTNSPEFGALPTTEPEAWGPTRGTPTIRPVGRVVGRPQPWRPAWCRSPTPATAAAPSGSPLHAADWWG